MEAILIYGQSFFGWILQTTLIASVVICLVLLIQKTLGGKLGPRWSHALWLVLLIRMVLPWAPSSRISLLNLIPSWDRQIQQQQLYETTQQQEAFQPVQATDTTEAIPDQGSQPDLANQKRVLRPQPDAVAKVENDLMPGLISLRRVLPVFWLAGAIVMGVYLFVSNFALWRIVKREGPLVNQEMLELFEKCRVQMGVQTLVVVVPSDQIRSPALFGFIRPRLLLPREMLEKANYEEIRYVFLHELAHLKRRDIYLGWLISFLQVLHWFNPLVWFAFYRMRSDRELACDALVLARTQKEESQEYGRAIVGLLRRFSRSRPLPAMAGIMENRSQLRRRITMIAKYNKSSYQWSPLAVILIIIIGCISLPDAKRTKASETSAAKLDNQPHFRKFRIPIKPGNGVLSPDGKNLAFVSKGGIWVVPVHGKVSPDIAGEPVRLTGTEGAWNWGMRWSADGKWIAYNTSPSEDHVGICIVPSSGGKVKRILNRYHAGVSVHNYLLSLSPDGKIVAFTSHEKGKIQLFTVNVEGGDVNQLTEDGGAQPAFSPDGKKIAYVKEKPQKTQIHKSDVWVIPAAGGTPVQVSDLPERATGPIWSPDGKMIAFTRKVPLMDTSKEICIVPVSETGKPEASPTQIELPLETWDFLAGWTLDNKIGALLTNPEHRAIYTVPASGGNATQVTPQGDYYSPRWSPDGKRIYLRWPHDPPGIASVPSEGGEISISHIDADSMIGQPLQWGGNVVSPDGKNIVFCASKKDNKPYSSTYIYTIPVEGGEPKQLTISPGWDRSPCWSPDGKSIAFIRYSDASWNKKKHDYINNICIVRPEGGEVRQLTSDLDEVARATIAWSPDGKSIAYYSEGKTIRVIPVKGGESREVVGVDRVNEWWDELAWSRDGKKLAYSSKGSIWVVSLYEGEPEEIKTGLDAKATHISWSPDGKKIAFTASEGGDTELWVMEDFLPGAPVAKPEVTPTLRQVWAGPDVDPHVAASPDGRYLSYVDWETGDLAIREIASGKTRPLTSKGNLETARLFALYSIISPDSRLVAYSWSNEHGTLSLCVVGIDGSADRTLCASEDHVVFPVCWSADSKQVVAKRYDNNGNLEIMLVSVEQGSVEVLKELDKPPFWEDFCYLSNDRFMVYDFPSEDNPSNYDIGLFDTQDNSETSLIEHPANDRLLGRLPNREEILFLSDRAGSQDIWAMKVIDGKAQISSRPVARDIGQINPHGLTRDGSFYFSRYTRRFTMNIIPFDAETGDIQEQSKKPLLGSNWYPAWSPDGESLAYVTEKGDNRRLHIRSLKTGEERELASNFEVRNPRWSPDGRFILVPGFDQNLINQEDYRGGIYKIDVQDGQATQLSGFPPDRHVGWARSTAEWSLDGKAIFYLATNGIVRRELESGQEKQLYQSNNLTKALDVSPDGKTLAFCEETPDEGTLCIMAIAVFGGEPRELCKIQEQQVSSTITWTPDGNYVLFAKDETKGSAIWRIAFQGGDPQMIMESSDGIISLGIHPNGKEIAYSTYLQEGAIWVMENFLPESVAVASE